MTSFAKSMDADLKKEDMETCMKEMAMEAIRDISKTKVDLNKYDWGRGVPADPRDVRAVGKPCMGRHSIAPFCRGSVSGTNGFGMWLTCQTCNLRLAYIPTWGSKGTHRSPGPLPRDTSEVLEQHPQATPEELTTQAIGLSGAETSALRRLEKIREEKAKMKAKAKPKAKSGNPQDMDLEVNGKKQVKRDHRLAPEVQEQETTAYSAGSEEWDKIDSPARP